MEPSIQPHLWGYIGKEFIVFISTSVRRLGAYCGLFTLFFLHVTRNISFYSWKTKRNVLRVLMRRQGIFNAHPRVAVATLSFGFFLTVVPFDLASGDTLANSPITSDGSILAGRTTYATVIAPQKTVNDSGESMPTINQVITHVVQGGDTLSNLSELYLVPVDAIAYTNGISESSLLHPGDELTIPPIEGLTHTVKSGESVASIAEKYSVSPQTIVDANLLKPPFDIFGGDVLVIPGGEVPAVVPQQVVLADVTQPTNSVPDGGLSLTSVPGSSAGYIMPTPGRITQYSSYYHVALDIAKGCSEPIWAANNGTVVYSGWRAGGYGFMVEVVHPDGRVTQYAHMSQTAVPVGASVSQGDVIGYTGATGIAYGCHLHFVVQEGGRAVNPLSVM